jgi:hypothetical protein
MLNAFPRVLFLDSIWIDQKDAVIARYNGVFI